MPADVCIVKCDHSFLLLEQLNDIVIGYCEDFRLAYGNHFY